MKKPSKLDEFRATALQMTQRGDVPADVTALMQDMLADLAHQTQLADINAKLSAGHRRQAQKYKREARVDLLTGLPNRRGFLEAFTQRVADSGRSGGQEHTLIFCDVDKFKPVNDTYGHDVGDLLIKHIGAILRPAQPNEKMGEHHLLRPTDVAGRFGGDEFVIMLSGVGKAQAGKMIATLQDRIKQEKPFTFTDKKTGSEVTRPVLISMGFSTFSNPKTDKVFERFMTQAGKSAAGVLITDYFDFHSKRADKRLYKDKKLRKSAEAAQGIQSKTTNARTVSERANTRQVKALSKLGQKL